MCFNVCAEVQVKNRRDCWSLEQNYTDLWGTQCGYWEPHSGLCKSSRFSLLWELLFSPNLYITIFKILFMFIYVSLDSCVSELHTHPLGSEESLGSPSPHSVFILWGPVFSGRQKSSKLQWLSCLKPSRLDYRHLIWCSVCVVSAEVWALVLMILHQML